MLVLFGVWIAFLPVLGFPRGFKNWLYVLTGILVVAFAYYAYIGALSRIAFYTQSINDMEHDEGSAIDDAR